MVICLILFTGAVASEPEEFVPYENPTTVEAQNLTFSLDQKVIGSGFHSSYRYALMPDLLGEEGRLYNGVELMSRSHGSGSMDLGNMIYAESTYLNRTWIEGAYDEDGEVIDESEDATSLVQLEQEGSMTYTPTRMPVGSRYYAALPLAFDSRIGESVWLKNRDGLSSISHSVQEAGGLKILLDAESDGVSNQLGVEEDVTDGRAHFGAIQIATLPRDEEAEEGSEDEDEASPPGSAMREWHRPKVELDHDYIGTFHIAERISLSFEEEEEEEEPWLPCCSGGYMEMPKWYRMGSGGFGSDVMGVFDCTCFKLP